MIKPASLRAFLVQTVAGIVDNPDRLAVFLDSGSIVCRATGSLSYEYRYTLTVALTPYAGDMDLLVVPLLAWISTNQPDLLADGAVPHPFKFDAEILNSDETDVTIELRLRESVQVTAKDGGGYEVMPISEPQFPDVFAGTDGTALLRQLYGNDVLLVQSTDPAWLATQADG